MTETPASPPDIDAEFPDAGRWRRRYRLLMAMARASLTWERLWPSLWPAAGIAAVFVAVALLDLLPMLPFWLHILVLVVFAAGFGFMVRGAITDFHAVDARSAERRLERDSGFAHRPLTALHDRLAADRPNAATQALWRIHLARMAEAVERLRVALPTAGLARRDPYGLRAAVLLLLVIGAAAGGGEAAARLERALVPRFDLGVGGPLKLEIWITPPAYTGLAPMFVERPTVALAAAGDEAPAPPTVRVPVGSTLLAQAGGTATAPELAVGGRVIRFAAIGEAADAGGYRLETVLEDGDRGAELLEVRLGGHLLSRWALEVVADTAPAVEFTRAPSRVGRGQLRVDYEARDDYGLAGLQLVIRHPEGRPVPGGDKAIRAELPLPGLGSSRTEGNSVQDFSAHPWAGLPVNAQLQAIDARGQAGESDVVTVVLPERIFNHPVARAIAEARKRLNTPDSGVIAEVAAVLNDLLTRPHHFYDDTIVFLALSVATSRLIHDGSEAAVGTVQKILWETALRIEDGEFAIADRDLRDIQERLMRALQQGKEGEEIERLLDELQQALDKFMTALAEHLEKQGLTQLPFDPSTRSLESTDLQRMIEEAREFARTGAREAARRMLSQLQRMLDNIRSGIQRGQPRQDLAQAKRLMDALRGLTQKQQQELDKTFQRQREGQGALQALPQQEGRGQQQGQGQGQRQGQDPQGERPGVQEQQALRRELGRLMLQMDELLGSIPSPFGQAERAMNEAVGALKKGESGGAVPWQTEALDKLRQGTEGLAEQMARRLGGAFGVTQEQRGMRPGQGSDPFGRAPGGAYGTSIDDGDVRIPSQMEQRRAREILHELRRRAGERDRPLPEQEYIDRLLKRF